jgi:TIR domain
LFISYRWIDAAFASEVLYQGMASEFGKANVFLDSHHFEGEETLSETIRNELATTDVVLVVIGEKWLTAPDP